jgi:putative membrane protein (TIGR04086 family)
MLAALNIRAVVAGFAAGGLSATVLAFLVGGSLTLLDVENGADIGLLVGVLIGLGVSGWVSGRIAVHSHRFHGSVTALLLGGLLILLASLGAAAASLLDVLILALVCIVVGGLGGVLGGRRGLPDQ